MQKIVAGGLFAVGLLASAGAQAATVYGGFTGAISSAVPGYNLKVGDPLAGYFTYNPASFATLSSGSDNYFGSSTAVGQPSISIYVDKQTFTASATTSGDLVFSKPSYNGLGANSALIGADTSFVDGQSTQPFFGSLQAGVDFAWTKLVSGDGELDVFSPTLAAIDFTVSRLGEINLSGFAASPPQLFAEASVIGAVAVPEPATIALLVSGLAGLALVRRRQA